MIENIELHLHLHAPKPEPHWSLRLQLPTAGRDQSRVWIVRLPLVGNPNAISSQIAAGQYELILQVAQPADFFYLTAYEASDTSTWLHALFDPNRSLPAALLLTVRDGQLTTLLYQPQLP